MGAAAGKVTCTVSSLANAASFAVSVAVKVTDSSGKTLTDTDGVSSLVFDPNTANNTATAATTIN